MAFGSQFGFQDEFNRGASVPPFDSDFDLDVLMSRRFPDSGGPATQGQRLTQQGIDSILGGGGGGGSILGSLFGLAPALQSANLRPLFEEEQGDASAFGQAGAGGFQLPGIGVGGGVRAEDQQRILGEQQKKQQQAAALKFLGGLII